MKNVVNRPRVDSGGHCLVTVPVSEVLAVSSVVAPAPVEHECPLYDGDDLTFGGDRLHELHREWRLLEAAAVDRWREIAELPLKQTYLQVRVEAMSQPLKRVAPPAQVAGFGRGLAEVVLALGISDGAALRAMLDRCVFERLTDAGVACAAVLLVDGVTAGSVLNGRDGEAGAVWSQLAEVTQCDAASRAAMTRLMTWISVEATPAVECWEVACLAKRVARVLAGLEKWARADGRTAPAERFAAGRAAVMHAQGFALFFE
jgi:hypothetical protein